MTTDKRYKQLAIERTKKTKAMRREQYRQVMSKEKVETYEDIIRLYYGLSGKSRERIVYNRLLELARDGLSPQTIIEILQEGKAMNGGNDDFDVLKELIGNEEAHKVAKAFGGANLYIPRSDVIAEIHRAIRKEYGDGATYRDLRIRYGYSESHIRYIIHKKRHD
jgi:Mor family transcriptional regulator